MATEMPDAKPFTDMIACPRPGTFLIMVASFDGSPGFAAFGYSRVTVQTTPLFKLGERVELYPSNLDMSTNVYDRYYIARGDQIVDVWPIMGRSGAAQR